MRTQASRRHSEFQSGRSLQKVRANRVLTTLTPEKRRGSLGICLTEKKQNLHPAACRTLLKEVKGLNKSIP